MVFARFVGSGGMYVADARAGEMQTASIVAAKAIKIVPLHFFRMLLLTFTILTPLTPPFPIRVFAPAAAAARADATSECARVSMPDVAFAIILFCPVSCLYPMG